MFLLESMAHLLLNEVNQHPHYLHLIHKHHMLRNGRIKVINEY